MRAGDFFINGLSGIGDLHAVLTTLPKIPKPKRKRLSFDIAGASRSAYIDEDSWEPREFELSIALVSESEEDRLMREGWLFNAFNQPGPVPFRYYAEPAYTYYIVSADVAEQDRPARMSQTRVWTIKAEADAYKYFERDKIIELDAAGKVDNPFLSMAKPLITVYGQGDITLNWGDQAIKLTGVTGNVSVDSDEFQQDIYTTAADGTQTLCAERATLSEFPVLAAYQHTPISWVGNVSKVIVEPRWRLL
ncbi:hypothetical protein [Schleiferilactobacillus perolens]|nr:hypothetical protein [Schleiferilactobacillus perolens]